MVTLELADAPFAEQLLGIAIDVCGVPEPAAGRVHRVEDLSCHVSASAITHPGRRLASHLEPLLVRKRFAVECRDAHAAITDGRDGGLADFAGRQGHVVVAVELKAEQGW